MSNDNDWACPHCAEPLPSRARFCRNCGASDESGWGRDGDEFGEDPDAGYADDSAMDDDDYADFVAREFPDHAEPNPTRDRRKSVIAMVMILVCVGIVLGAILSSLAGR